MKWQDAVDMDDDVLEYQLTAQRLRRRRNAKIGAVATLVVGSLVTAGIYFGVMSQSQSGLTSRLGMGDSTVELEDRCETLNAAGKFVSGDSQKKFTDCITSDGTHVLKEHTTWSMLEPSYQFIIRDTTDPKAPGYQGGWVSRLGGDDQSLGVSPDCTEIINTGKDGKKKFIVCKSEDEIAYLTEFSDLGVLEATYIFTREGRDQIYQGGWVSRLTTIPQELSLPKECLEVKTAGRTGRKKFVDCELENQDRMLQEFTDAGALQATYIFTHDETDNFYQGGWVSRVGGKPKMLTIPKECTSVINVGKAGRTKYITCNTENGPMMQEYSDFGLLEATYRFE